MTKFVLAEAVQRFKEELATLAPFARMQRIQEEKATMQTSKMKHDDAQKYLAALAEVEREVLESTDELLYDVSRFKRHMATLDETTHKEFLQQAYHQAFALIEALRSEGLSSVAYYEEEFHHPSPVRYTEFDASKLRQPEPKELSLEEARKLYKRTIEQIEETFTKQYEAIVETAKFIHTELSHCSITMPVLPDDSREALERFKKVDVARLLQAVQNAGFNVDEGLFAQAFGYDNDASMKKSKYKEPQKSERILRLAEGLAEALSPEERIALRNAIKQ